MQKSIIEAYPDAKIKVYIAWSNILVGDNDAAVHKASAIFSAPRVTQFHDSERRLSHQVGKLVNFPAVLPILDHLGRTQEDMEKNFQKGFITGPGAAFDMFFFYEAGAKMEPELPAPKFWYTQMDAEVWKGMTPEHTFRSKVLEDQLRITMEQMLKNDKPTNESQAPSGKAG